MGCCASRPEGDEPTQAIRAHSSSRNITAPSTRPGSIPSPRASQANLQPSGSRHDAIDRPNTPLKAIATSQRSRLPNTLASPTATAKSRNRQQPLTDSTNLTWTRSRLEKERNDWWDTQVTGSQEVWGALRLAVQYLQAGELEEAQTMLKATECTCPTGCLWKGVYDSTGIMYKVDEWLVVEPEGLVEENDSEDEAPTGSAGAVVGTDGAQGLDEDVGDTKIVRARISSTNRDVAVRMRGNEPVASIVDKLKKQAQLPIGTKIRLAYGGRLYTDHETLESHQYWNWANDYLLSALVIE